MVCACCSRALVLLVVRLNRKPYLPACTGLSPSLPPSPRCGGRLEKGQNKACYPCAWSSSPPQPPFLDQAHATPETAALSTHTKLAVNAQEEKVTCALPLERSR